MAPFRMVSSPLPSSCELKQFLNTKVSQGSIDAFNVRWNLWWSFC